MKIYIIVLAASVFFLSCGYPSDVDTRYAESRYMTQPGDLAIAGDWSFIFLADTHVNGASNGNFSKLSPVMGAAGDELVLVGGDIIEWGKESDFIQAKADLDSLGKPWYVTIGNHDIYDTGWNYYKTVFGPTCYTFAAGDVRFIALDTANGTLGAAQLAWLTGVLQQKTESHCVIFTHFQIHNTNPMNFIHISDTEEIHYLISLFETYEVDYVLMGHIHTYTLFEIKGVRYVTTRSFKYDGNSKEVIRVNVTAAGLSHDRVVVQ